MKLSIVFYIFMMLATHNDNLVRKVKYRGHLKLIMPYLLTLLTRRLTAALLKQSGNRQKFNSSSFH
jgi:hypothetical protein